MSILIPYYYLDLSISYIMKLSVIFVKINHLSARYAKQQTH